jgi:hypothetical protein
MYIIGGGLSFVVFCDFEFRDSSLQCGMFSVCKVVLKSFSRQEFAENIVSFIRLPMFMFHVCLA